MQTVEHERFGSPIRDPRVPARARRDPERRRTSRSGDWCSSRAGAGRTTSSPSPAPTRASRPFPVPRAGSARHPDGRRHASSSPARATSPACLRGTTPGSSATSRSWWSTGSARRTGRRSRSGCGPRRPRLKHRAADAEKAGGTRPAFLSVSDPEATLVVDVEATANRSTDPSRLLPFDADAHRGLVA